MPAGARRKAPAQADPKDYGTRERILEVALREFSDKGLSGARVDEIADLTRTSKRMIYYHFSSKEGLYRAVLERAYAGIRESEASLDLDHMAPDDALAAIIRLSFDYHQKNEHFVRLAMNENIHYAEHIKELPSIGAANRQVIERLQRILDRGAEAGVFRRDIDPLQLHMTISAFGFHYMSNRYTFSHIFECDMRSAAAAAKRRAIAIETIVGWCQAKG
jgi:AcrR family transcriptional regulator